MNGKEQDNPPDIKQAECSGKIFIRRKDGKTFALTPETMATPPLDVPSAKAKVTTNELIDIIRERVER